MDDGKYAEATKAAVKLSGDPSDVSFLAIFLKWFPLLTLNAHMMIM